MRWLLCLRPSQASPGLGHSKNQRTLPVACKALCNPRPNRRSSLISHIYPRHIRSWLCVFALEFCSAWTAFYFLVNSIFSAWNLSSVIFNPVRSSDHSFCGTLHTWIHCMDPQCPLLNPYDQVYFRNKKVQNLEKWCRAFTTDHVATPKGHICSLLSTQVRYQC